MRPTFPAPSSPPELGDASLECGCNSPDVFSPGPERSSVVQCGRDEATRLSQALPITVLRRHLTLGREHLSRMREASGIDVVSPQGFVPLLAKDFVGGVLERPVVGVRKWEGAGFPRRDVLERRGRGRTDLVEKKENSANEDPYR